MMQYTTQECMMQYTTQECMMQCTTQDLVGCADRHMLLLVGCADRHMLLLHRHMLLPATRCNTLHTHMLLQSVRMHTCVYGATDCNRLLQSVAVSPCTHLVHPTHTCHTLHTPVWWREICVLETLRHAATHCTALQHTELHCNTQQQICELETLRHSATQCDTLNRCVGWRGSDSKSKSVLQCVAV